MLQAFDKATGELVWERELVAHTTGGPRTYLAGARQVIVVAAGGGRGAPVPSTLIALALPAAAIPAAPTAATAVDGDAPSPALAARAASDAAAGGAPGTAASGDAVAAAAAGTAPAIDLARVKIAELQTSDELCPVHLVPSDSALPSWTHDGVAYRGHGPECEQEFRARPEHYAELARRQRWINNFKIQMSSIWCPLMNDQINTGGRKQWTHEGLVWESCCAFCDETEPTAEDFARALAALEKRARFAYEASGGRYVEGAASPVEGAMVVAADAE
jgi:hypothetical protein